MTVVVRNVKRSRERLLWGWGDGKEQRQGETIHAVLFIEKKYTVCTSLDATWLLSDCFQKHIWTPTERTRGRALLRSTSITLLFFCFSVYCSCESYALPGILFRCDIIAFFIRPISGRYSRLLPLKPRAGLQQSTCNKYGNHSISYSINYSINHSINYSVPTVVP